MTESYARRYIKRERAQTRAYSQAAITDGGRTVWLAGQVGATDASGSSLAGDFDGQVREAFSCLSQTLAEAGGKLSDMVTRTCLSGVAAILVTLLGLGWFSAGAAAQGTKGTNVIIRLRLAGDTMMLPAVRSCLVDKLSQMPDVKVATAPAEGVRFVADVVAGKSADDTVLASLVVAETFPMEQFRPRIKEGEDADALLKSIRYYTLLRLHEIVPARSSEDLCLTITGDIGDKVLSKEYTERND